MAGDLVKGVKKTYKKAKRTLRKVGEAVSKVADSAKRGTILRDARQRLPKIDLIKTDQVRRRR